MLRYFFMNVLRMYAEYMHEKIVYHYARGYGKGHFGIEDLY